MPPAYPYGGMENPLLTYASPSILQGDSYSVQTVLHEIVHQWVGNRVTLKTWQDIWLNEGITVYLQRKIMQKIDPQNDLFVAQSILGN